MTKEDKKLVKFLKKSCWYGVWKGKLLRVYRLMAFIKRFKNDKMIVGDEDKLNSMISIIFGGVL